MTAPVLMPPEHPRRRLRDRGKLGTLLSWWQEWGPPVLGICFLAMCAFGLHLADGLRANTTAGSLNLKRSCLQISGTTKEKIHHHEIQVINDADLATYMNNRPTYAQCQPVLTPRDLRQVAHYLRRAP